MIYYRNMKVGIIGSGPAGVYASITLAKDAKVVLIEREDRLGGTCVLYGCIPTKSMLTPLTLSSFLSSYKREIKFDIDELRSFALDSINKISKGVESMLNSIGVEVIHSNAYIRSSMLHAGNSSINVDKILIASGTRRERVKGLKYTEDLPYERGDYQKVIIIGGDVGGIELSWLLNRLGKEVALVDRNSSLLSNVDKDLSTVVTSYFNQLGVSLYLGEEVVKVNDNSVTLKSGKVISGDAVFLTYGRKTNLEGFEEIPHDKFIYVDEFLRTETPNVYAAGDIIGTYTAHEAIYGGVIAGKNILGYNEEFIAEGVPKVIYTHPQIAYTGVPSGKCVTVNTLSLTKSIIDRDEGGLFKICERDGKVTGAIAFMPEAESVVSLVSALIRLEVSLKDALNLILPHPSYLEVLSESLRVLK